MWPPSTHTHFFGDEELTVIRAEAEKLEKYGLDRISGRYFDDELADRFRARLTNLNIAIALLAEPVD